MQATPQTQRREGLVIGVLLTIVTALYAVPFLRLPNNFFADDSYFYFQVAWNIARGMGSTFNNIIPTNGYHPLWMLFCVAIFKFVPGKVAALHAIAALIILLDVAAIGVIAATLRRVAPAMIWAACLIYIPFCFLGQLGTEGALSGMVLATLMLSSYQLVLTPTRRSALVFALCGTFAVLSRLDNIFIVGLSFLAVFLVEPHESTSARTYLRTLLLQTIPVYIVLWGAYIASNILWFGTIQPISGMLKVHPQGEATHIHPPSHTGMLAALVILLCLPLVARFRRDTFFRVVELPFAAGVLIHSIYVMFFMSSETHWTWYYTSWVLLAAILLARAASIVTADRVALRPVLAAVALCVLMVLWYRGIYKSLGRHIYGVQGEGYQQNLEDRLHLHAILVFDKPGRIAYFSSVPVIALDGLMGDLAFQHTLSDKGIAYFDALHGVDSFSGPPQPLTAEGKDVYCDKIYLSAVRFHCVPASQGRFSIDSVEVFSRLTGTSGGVLPLPQTSIVWNTPDDVTVWRLPPAQLSTAR